MSKEKLLASAQKNLEKGQLARAIKDYQAVVDKDPRDIRNRQKLAELYSRARQNEQALEQYAAVAKYYSENGFYLKAIAVYKQMQRLDPARPEFYVRLAELNQKQGLTGNAAAEYRNLVAFYEARKMFPEAVGALEKLKELEPDNLNLRINIIETFLRGGVQERARKECEAVLSVLRQKDEPARALRLYELFLPLYPKDTELKAGYGETLVRHGDVARGVQILTDLAAMAPDNIRVLQGLAEGYRRQGDFAGERRVLEAGLALGADNLEFREAFIRSLLAAGDCWQALAEVERYQELFLQARKTDALREFTSRLLAALPNEPRMRRLQPVNGEAEPEGEFHLTADGDIGSPAPVESPVVPPSVEPLPEHRCSGEAAETEPPGGDEPEELTLADLSCIEDPSQLMAEFAGAPVTDTPGGVPLPEPAGADLEFELELELDLDVEPEPGGEITAELVELAEELPEEFREEPAGQAAEHEAGAAEEEAAVLDLTEEAVDDSEPLELDLSPELLVPCFPGLPLDHEGEDSAPAPAGAADFIDFGAVLREEGEAPNLAQAAAGEAVAPPRKKGIRTETVQLEDAESHFQLGIAYKEMGLLEDAVNEFEQAMKDPSRGVACLILKGICLAARGANDEAAAAFRAGLVHPRLVENEKLSLHFELGALYEEQGALLDALDSFQYVADRDLFFREVGQRIVSLRRRLGLDGGNDGEEKQGAKGNRKRVSYI